MKEKSKRARSKIEYGNGLGNSIFWLSVGLLFFIPLTFSTSVHAIYSLPKFVLLLIGASVIVLLLTIYASRHWQLIVPLFKSNQVKLVGAYFVILALSTVFSVAPRVSVFGSNSNFMGLLTRLCFFICFLGVIAGIGASEGGLLKALWTISICGGLVAAYAMAQFFGVDPFAPVSIYTFSTSVGDVIRVCSSIGHSNYLGNFLLYTTPLSAGLALATEKRERLMAALVTALSLLAIVFSVARGAWVGIIVGTTFFIILELRYVPAKQVMKTNNLLRYTAIFLLVSSVAVCIIAFSPASRSINERVQALLAQGVKSSGRLVLWRDSVKMLPTYALTGVGAEGFRKALLVYKSKELAKLSQPDNNESSHNSYLDVAISHGLLGLALYLAIIISTLMILMRARRRAAAQSWRIIISGITASFVAVLTHNLFIFDQLSTGLYFFAFIGLASALSNVFDNRAAKDQAVYSPQSSMADEIEAKPHAKPGSAPNQATPMGLRLWTNRALTALAALAVVLAVWYSAGLIAAELAFKKIFDPAIARNFQAIAKRCEEVADSPLPTGAYPLMVAKALDTYSQSLLSFANSGSQLSPEANNLLTLRSRALQLGISYAEKSLAHTNTPDLNYNTLASISLAAGDTGRLKFAATEAVKSDPNNFYSRWLLAEAYLANGENEAAAGEATLSLELAPKFNNAISTLARAQTQADEERARKKLEAQSAIPSGGTGRSIAQLIVYAHQLSRQGNWQKAKRKLLMAIVRSPDDCLECHRELANVYEKLEFYPAAISEWGKVVRQTTDSAALEQISARMETLKQNTFSKEK